MITGILLAAGAGTRFGGNKLLFPMPDGIPIGVKAARSLLSGVDHGIAVVRPDDQLLAHILEAEGLHIAFCPDPKAAWGPASHSHPHRTERRRLADRPRRHAVHPARHHTQRCSLLQSGAPIAAPQHQGRAAIRFGFAENFSTT